MSIAELMSAIRTAGEDRFLDPEMLTISPLAEDLIKRMETTVVSSLEKRKCEDAGYGRFASPQLTIYSGVSCCPAGEIPGSPSCGTSNCRAVE